MREKTKHPLQCTPACRRSFLRSVASATIAGLTAPPLLVTSAHADALTRARRDGMTPEQIIAAMKRGNERFQKGERKPRNYLREQKASAQGQYPAAVLLSCIDSRAPARIKPAVDATQYDGERTATNYAFVDKVARKNVELTIAQIRRDSSVLSEMESQHAIRIAGSMYNLSTGAVEFFS